MSAKKITDLTVYTAAEVQPSDLLFITDVVNQETKAITVLSYGSYNNSRVGSYTGSFSGSYIGTASFASSSISASYAVSASYAPSVVIGEVNTVSNTGSHGYGIFDEKVGSDIRLRNIAASDGTITIDHDLTNHLLTIKANTTTTTPGGSTGQVQFHAAGSVFSGNNGFVWGTGQLTVVGDIKSTTFSSTTTNAVAYVGTSSFAVSCSMATSSSNSISSSFSTSGSYASTASYSTNTNIGILSHTSPLTINNYTVASGVNSYYSYAHGLGATPSYFYVNLICTSSELGFAIGDEIPASNLRSRNDDWDDSLIGPWSNATDIGASSWYGYGQTPRIQHKTSGLPENMDRTRWKFKFYYKL